MVLTFTAPTCMLAGFIAGVLAAALTLVAVACVFVARKDD